MAIESRAKAVNRFWCFLEMPRFRSACHWIRESSLRKYKDFRASFLNFQLESNFNSSLSKMKGPKPLKIVIKLGKYKNLQEIMSLIDEAGTSSIVDEKTHEPLLSILSLIVETAVKLHKDGHKVVIVSSGAIGVGLRRMDMERRPKNLPRTQVSSVNGQIVRVHVGCPAQRRR